MPIFKCTRIVIIEDLARVLCQRLCLLFSELNEIIFMKFTLVAPFYTITFPFLFGVMFGDLGHGFCILLVGLYLLWNEKRFEKEKGENDVLIFYYYVVH